MLCCPGERYRAIMALLFKNGGHLGFSTEMILGTFDLQVTLIPPTKFPVNWPFGSGKEVQNSSFQDGGQGPHLVHLTWLPSCLVHSSQTSLAIW